MPKPTVDVKVQFVANPYRQSQNLNPGRPLKKLFVQFGLHSVQR
ncbi:hypothetical protein [Paraburkholderia sp. BCC1885]|nr:hypothetical protein [Paraburkholderia sp. BCC1885]